MRLIEIEKIARHGSVLLHVVYSVLPFWIIILCFSLFLWFSRFPNCGPSFPMVGSAGKQIRSLRKTPLRSSGLSYMSQLRFTSCGYSSSLRFLPCHGTNDSNPFAFFFFFPLWLSLLVDLVSGGLDMGVMHRVGSGMVGNAHG
ncbi:hypothetical protein BDV59DRAFT_135693 [Aspergillus ambiguus]|uniref:uncharacterized protein n=1 Tax=Aspergillus ambiguus TaxID=176160 RepID=UPI003CCE0F9C